MGVNVIKTFIILFNKFEALSERIQDRKENFNL